MKSSSLDEGVKIAICIGKHGILHSLQIMHWFALKKAWNLVFAVVVNFPRSKTKCSVMFYSLETNQNEITMSSSLGGNQNSNLYWKTWDLCIVSKLCLVCS